MKRHVGSIAATVLLLLAGAGCEKQVGGKPPPKGSGGKQLLRVGYFPNLTHAPALLGLTDGTFAKGLGPEVELQTFSFVAGPQAMEALFAGEIDLTYVGPNPAINAFQKSQGTALRVIAGATSGGAALVVKPEIADAAGLAGKRLCTPQLGNTQDVALRAWLKHQGLATKEKGGSVEVIPTAPADTLSLFQRGEIAGAWVPEPWASRMVLEGGGKVLVNEETLWPGGVFPTTVLIASPAVLEAQPELVRRFVRAHQEVVERLQKDPVASREKVGKRLAEETGKALPPAVLERAFAQLKFTTDTFGPQLARSAEEAKSLGFLKSADITGLVDPGWLEKAGPPPAPAAPRAPSAH